MALVNVRQFGKIAAQTPDMVSDNAPTVKTQLDTSGTDEINLAGSTLYVILQALDADCYVDFYAATGGAPSATGANGEILLKAGERVALSAIGSGPRWLVVAAAS